MYCKIFAKISIFLICQIIGKYYATLHILKSRRKKEEKFNVDINKTLKQICIMCGGKIEAGKPLQGKVLVVNQNPIGMQFCTD